MHIRICPLKLLPAQVMPEMLSGSVAVISSTAEPDYDRLPKMPYILRLYEDIDVEAPGRSFSAEDAAAFADFIKHLPSRVDTVWCCCNAGESRSPAVAAAICRYFEQNDLHIWNNPHYHPNMLVFELLTQALGVPVSDEELDFLLYENQMAFKNAIKRQ